MLCDDLGGGCEEGRKAPEGEDTCVCIYMCVCVDIYISVDICVCVWIYVCVWVYI